MLASESPSKIKLRSFSYLLNNATDEKVHSTTPIYIIR